MFAKRKKHELNSKFNQFSTEDEIAAFVDKVKLNPSWRNLLVPLLRESHCLYKTRGTQECIRLRGYILAAFEVTGLPKSALIFALEDLYNTRSAYLIGGAAKAIRGMESPNPQVVSYLLEAVVNIRYMDDAITYESYKPSWPCSNHTTGLREVFKTFAWLGAYAQAALPTLADYADCPSFEKSIQDEIKKTIKVIKDDNRIVDLSCCGASVKSDGRQKYRNRKRKINPLLEKIVLEDQDGTKVPFNSFFKGKVTVVSFFYTRCISINKCSLTVGNTGRLAKLLIEKNLAESVNIALITYDPIYDLPDRIKVYGENRRCEFSDSFKGFRVSADDYELLKEHFKLEVGYSTSVVNQHQVETYLLDHTGKVNNLFSRIQWNEAEIIEQIEQLNREKTSNVFMRLKKAIIENFRTMIFPLVLAVFPKCPVCWAAYMSAFGIAGLKDIPYSPWFVLIFIAGIMMNLYILFRSRKKRNGIVPFWVSLIGALILIGFGMLIENEVAKLTGILLIFLGSVLNSLPFSVFQTSKGWIEDRLRFH